MDIDEFDAEVQRGLRRLINSARQCAPSGTCFEIPDARRTAIFSHILGDYYALTVEDTSVTVSDSDDSPVLEHLERIIHTEDDDALGVVFVPTDEPNHPEHYDTILYMRKSNGRPDFTKVIVFVEHYHRAWVSRGFAHPSSELFQNIEQYMMGFSADVVRGGRRLRLNKRKRMTKRRRLSHRRHHRTSKKKQMRRH